MYTPPENNIWMWTLRFSALPNRWIKVTRPGLGRGTGEARLLDQVRGKAAVDFAEHS